MAIWDENQSHTAVASPLATPTAGEIVGQGLALRQVQTSYVTAVAVQQPRNLRECERKFLEEAALLGEDAYYSWAAGKDRIEGPSVHLALAAVRCFKNAVVEALPVQENAAAYIFTSAIIDLENGVTVTRQFRQAKNWTVYGKMDDARKEDIRFQIGQSKSHRNVILHALPSWFIERGYQAAKEGVRKKIEQYIEKHSMESARQLLVDAFKRVGVTEEMILQKIERASLKAVTIEDMVVLQGDLRAIETGAEAAASLFPMPAVAEDSPSRQTADRVKDRLRQRRGGDVRDETKGLPATEETTPSQEVHSGGNGDHSSQDSVDGQEAILSDIPPEIQTDDDGAIARVSLDLLMSRAEHFGTQLKLDRLLAQYPALSKAQFLDAWKVVAIQGVG